jgi:DNA-binding MarR family transcriptional regulator
VLEELSRQYAGVDPGAVRAVVSLLRLGFELHSASSQHFARYKLSQARFVVLMMLHTMPGGEMCCSDIADAVGVSRATMTGLLDGLEREGLVRRVNYPDDRRRITITLTANGRRLLDKMLPDHMERIAGVMANLSGEDRDNLLELLDKVRSGLPALARP